MQFKHIAGRPVRSFEETHRTAPDRVGEVLAGVGMLIVIALSLLALRLS